MINNFQDIINQAQEKGPLVMSVAVAQDKDVLLAVNNAYKYKIIEPILVGNKTEIESIAQELNIDTKKFRIVNCIDKIQACREAVRLVSNGEASMVMKGLVDTSFILKPVLDKEIGLMKGNLLSHVGVLSVEGFNRLFILSDGAMNIAPNLEDKKQIVENAVNVAHGLGIKKPKVAILCAVEKVNSKMPATIDARELTNMNREGKIKNCILQGPLALDNSVCIKAANHKSIDGPVAGKADVLIVPDIEAGNMLNKSMEYFARAEKAGIIMGASSPIVLTSRASSKKSKLYSIALAVLMSKF